MTYPTQEAGEALSQRSGIVYLLLPRRHRRCPWTPRPAAHGRGDWDHQPAAARAIDKETRFPEALSQAPSQALGRSVPAAQAVAAPWTLVRIIPPLL